MSTLEFSRLRTRMEQLESAMHRMESVMSRIETMYDSVESRREAAERRHEVMMQEKSNMMRSGLISEIRANMSVVKRELLTEVKLLKSPEHFILSGDTTIAGNLTVQGEVRVEEL